MRGQYTNTYIHIHMRLLASHVYYIWIGEPPMRKSSSPQMELVRLSHMYMKPDKNSANLNENEIVFELLLEQESRR